MITITTNQPRPLWTPPERPGARVFEPAQPRPERHLVGGIFYVALDCHCRDQFCPGWSVVRDEPDAIAYFTRLFGTATSA